MTPKCKGITSKGKPCPHPPKVLGFCERHYPHPDAYRAIAKVKGHPVVATILALGPVVVLVLDLTRLVPVYSLLHPMAPPVARVEPSEAAKAEERAKNHLADLPKFELKVSLDGCSFRNMDVHQLAKVELTEILNLSSVKPYATPNGVTVLGAPMAFPLGSRTVFGLDPDGEVSSERSDGGPARKGFSSICDELRVKPVVKCIEMPGVNPPGVCSACGWQTGCFIFHECQARIVREGDPHEYVAEEMNVQDVRVCAPEVPLESFRVHQYSRETGMSTQWTNPDVAEAYLRISMNKSWSNEMRDAAEETTRSHIKTLPTSP